MQLNGQLVSIFHVEMFSFTRNQQNADTTTPIPINFESELIRQEHIHERSISWLWVVVNIVLSRLVTSHVNIHVRKNFKIDRSNKKDERHSQPWSLSLHAWCDEQTGYLTVLLLNFGLVRYKINAWTLGSNSWGRIG